MIVVTSAPPLACCFSMKRKNKPEIQAQHPASRYPGPTRTACARSTDTRNERRTRRKDRDRDGYSPVPLVAPAAGPSIATTPFRFPTVFALGGLPGGVVDCKPLFALLTPVDVPVAPAVFDVPVGAV